MGYHLNVFDMGLIPFYLIGAQLKSYTLPVRVRKIGTRCCDNCEPRLFKFGVELIKLQTVPGLNWERRERCQNLWRM